MSACSYRIAILLPDKSQPLSAGREYPATQLLAGDSVGSPDYDRNTDCLKQPRQRSRKCFRPLTLLEFVSMTLGNNELGYHSIGTAFAIDRRVACD